MEDGIKVAKSDLMPLRDNILECKKKDKKDNTAIVSKPRYYKNWRTRRE